MNAPNNAAAGRAIINPIDKESLLVRQLADVIGENWIRGADFQQIASAILDRVALHIRKSEMENLHPAICDAIEDHLRVDPLEFDPDADSECSVEDIEQGRARMQALLSMKTSGDRYICSDPGASLRKMLKRPGEVKKYDALRIDGHTPASALSLILAERRVASMKTNPPVVASISNGGVS